MTTQATLVYTAYLGGLSAAAAATLMGAVPVDPGILGFYGLRVLSDSTPVASPVVRTIVLGFNPSVTATAAAHLESHDSGSSVISISVSGAGADYVQPPAVSFTGGRPAIPVQEIPFGGPRRAHQTMPDTASPTNEFQPQLNASACAFAYLKVVSAAVAAGGGGYSAATFIRVSGQLKSQGGPHGVGPPTGVGRPAILTPTIALGVITGVTVTDPGSGYVGVPTITVVDPAVTPGTGGKITVSMGVGSIEVTRGGAGYASAPTVVLTPFFQAMFPPTGDQGVAFRHLFTTSLETALKSPITASPPVIA